MNFGINLSGAEYGIGQTSDTLGVNYFFPTQTEIDYYADKGLTEIRLPISWERLQPTLGGPLDAGYLKQIQNTIAMAAADGLKVTIDMHNYGAYDGSLIGSDAVPVSTFADVWGKLAGALKGDGNVAFGLMNEPQLPTAADWLTDANAAIAAIRTAGATQQVLVSGTQWDGAWTWLTDGNSSVIGATGAIVDPLHNYAIEVHQYLDANSSGQSSTTPSASTGVDRLTAITEWARTNDVPLYLGEYGAGSDTTSLAALANMTAYLAANSDVWEGADYWGGGAVPTNYIFGIAPGLGILDTAQMQVLSKVLDVTTKTTQLANGTSQVDTVLPGSTTPSITDVYGADGALVSRILFTSGGLAERMIVVGADGDYTLTTYTADGVHPGTVAVYSATKQLLGNTVYAADGTSEKTTYESNGSTLVEDRDAAGALTQTIVNDGTTHVITHYTAGVVSSIETDSNAWSFLSRDTYDTTGHLLVHQTQAANGYNTVVTYDLATNQATSSVYSADWTLISSTTYHAIAPTLTPPASGYSDTMHSSISYTLPDHVENLILDGTANINGFGNALDNTLTGNSGANVLNGLAGADTMIGGAGNDTYYVDNHGDIVTEAANAGNDTVHATLGYTLPNNVENLYLDGSANTYGFGNALNNLIVGNSGNNDIYGAGGRDTLTGGAGADTFVYTRASDSTVAMPDLITDFVSGTDKIDLSRLHTSSADTFKIVSNGSYTYAEVDQGGNGTVDLMIKVAGANAVKTSDIVWGTAPAAAVTHTTTAVDHATTIDHAALVSTLHAAAMDHGSFA